MWDGPLGFSFNDRCVWAAGRLANAHGGPVHGFRSIRWDLAFVTAALTSLLPGMGEGADRA